MVRAERMTQAEMLAALRSRFGDDPDAWAFVCPSCGDVASVADFSAALATAGRSTESPGDHVGQVCIGRILGALDKSDQPYAGRGCNWCAFGLFSGPMFVVTPEGKEIPSFRIAEVTS